MRWRFPDAHNADEARQRGRIIKTIDSWWAQFVDEAPQISSALEIGSGFDVTAFVGHHLREIHPDLKWEIRNHGSECQLIITPEAERHLRPLVDVIIERAPSLPHWEFHSYRPPMVAPEALRVAKRLTGLDLSLLSVSATRGDYNRVDVICSLPEGTVSLDTDRWEEAAFAATEGVVGQKAVETWLGIVRVEERKSRGLLGRLAHRQPTSAAVHGRTGSLESLAASFQSVVASIDQGLPDQPQAAIEDPGKGTVFRLDPEESTDYAAQADLLVGSSCGLPDMWRAAHTQLPFSSRRFSRHGESYCYVKLDGSAGLHGSPFEDRHDIEDALDDALRPDLVGTVVGGGTGSHYSYIDLALLQLDRGIAEARRVLRNGKLPHRSWLLFFDAEWADEWIGIYDDTPAPPR